jgi:type IV secretory pathway VirB10-like protein
MVENGVIIMAGTDIEAEALNPNNSPTKQKPVGVKKVNNWPLVILISGIGVFALIMMLVAMDRAEQQELRQTSPAVQEEKFAGDTSAQANAIIGNRESGYIPANSPLDNIDSQTQMEIPEAPRDTLDPEVASITSNNPTSRNLDHKRPTGDESRKLELLRSLEQQKLRRLQDAIEASSSMTLSGVSGGYSNNPNSIAIPRSGQLQQLESLSALDRKLEAQKAHLSTDPIASYQQVLKQIQSSGVVGNAVSGAAQNQPMSLISTDEKTTNSIEQFAGNSSRWDLSSRPEAPKSPYQIHAGFVIPAIMITGINSDLAGQIMGQVSQNIYDTVRGQFVLIPQGSRLVGTYSSNIQFGQEAVFVAWQRIIFPDGKTMDIGSMQGADAAGLSGFRDQVDHHYLRIFGSALMMSVITAGVELSQDDGDSVNEERSALTEALGQQLGQAAAQLIMRNLNVSPTINIRSGYRFNIMVSKDMIFNRPYSSYDY